jgi:16S rRNA (uracil1498-N3)-methyltransferase
MPKQDFRSPRLFIDSPMAIGQALPLNADQANYLGNVLRLAAGAHILIFNGREGEWRGAIAGRKRPEAVVIESQTRPQDAPSRIRYVFAPLKHARLDYMAQKAVEMGAAALLPVLTRHTQVSRINIDRMQANAIEAAEQCGILSLATVAEPVPFQRFLDSRPTDHLLVFCDEDADEADPIAALKQAGAARQAGVDVLIGPEGGFSDDERAALLKQPNIARISLGPRILRADTAAVAALALVNAALS